MRWRCQSLSCASFSRDVEPRPDPVLPAMAPQDGIYKSTYPSQLRLRAKSPSTRAFPHLPQEKVQSAWRREGRRRSTRHQRRIMRFRDKQVQKIRLSRPYGQNGHRLAAYGDISPSDDIFRMATILQLSVNATPLGSTDVGEAWDGRAAAQYEASPPLTKTECQGRHIMAGRVGSG